MFMRRGQSVNVQAELSAPPGAAPISPVSRQVSSVALPPPRGLSWGMLAVAVTLGLLLITGLTLSALAFRPRDPAPTPHLAPAQTTRFEIPAVPTVLAASKSETPAPVLVAQISPPPAAVEPQPAPAPLKETPPPAVAELVPAVQAKLAPPPEPAPPEPPVPAPAPPPEPAPPQPPPAAESTSCGTSVHFVASPQAAARRAEEEGKLVFTLHVSGNFEDPGFT